MKWFRSKSTLYVVCELPAEVNTALDHIPLRDIRELKVLPIRPCGFRIIVIAETCQLQEIEQSLSALADANSNPFIG